MNDEERIELIRRARALVLAAMSVGDLPQIDAMLRNADLELHWALWNLGEAVSLRPDDDYGALPVR